MKEIKYTYVVVTTTVCISSYEDDQENSIRGLKPDFVSTVGDCLEELMEFLISLEKQVCTK